MIYRGLLGLWMGLCLPCVLWAGEAKVVGLQFSIGQPMDRPAAKVAIAEVTQGAQKRGFLRVALLPLVVAKGVDIRFHRPEPAALGEVRETLLSMVKLEAQEFRNLRIFSGADPVPSLVAAEVTPKAGHWVLKGARVRVGGGYREMAECSLVVAGPQAGECTPANGGGPFRWEMETVSE